MTIGNQCSTERMEKIMAQDTPAPGGHDVHIDFHVTTQGRVRHTVLSADEVKVDIGSGLSLFIKGADDLDTLCDTLLSARQLLKQEERKLHEADRIEALWESELSV